MSSFYKGCIMAKRYYQNRKDRKDESRGMKKYLKQEMYAGKEMRDRMEYDASMMIREDKSAIANLPQNAVMRDYPKTQYAYSDLPDSLGGIDMQMRDDSKHQKSGKYPEKY